MPTPLLVIAACGVAVARAGAPYSPAPPPGQWSPAHNGSWCDKGALLADLGKGVARAKCQAACEAKAGCGYACHADQTDGRCMLYATCPTPICGHRSGWFTTYQLGRPGAQSWVPCPPAPPPAPPPLPSPGAMQVMVVAPETTARFGAKCLDGTPPAYSIRPGVGANASRFILFLEGGGWCFDVASCGSRRRGGLGSSKSYVPGTTQRDYGGVMSLNSTINPDFHAYTVVFAHYCDGSSFSSFRPDPIKLDNGQEMWMRGKANLDALLHELSTIHGLATATELVLSGGSAGGLAVYYHLDYVAAFVHRSSPAARVTGFPDAGYFADLPSTDGTHVYRGFFQGADASCWNSTLSGGTNAACLAAHAGEEWKCLMAEYLTDHIETPMYVMNSAFDVYQVQHILVVGCVPKPCTTTQISAMEGYRRDFLNSSLGHLVARAPAIGHGAFVDSCLVHEQNVDYCSGGNPHAYNCAGWLTTKVAGLTPQQAYSAWYRGDAARNLTVDTAATLAPDAAANPTCPWTFPTGTN